MKHLGSLMSKPMFTCGCQWEFPFKFNGISLLRFHSSLHTYFYPYFTFISFSHFLVKIVKEIASPSFCWHIVLYTAATQSVPRNQPLAWKRHQENTKFVKYYILVPHDATIYINQSQGFFFFAIRKIYLYAFIFGNALDFASYHFRV